MFTFKHFFLLNFHCVTYSALILQPMSKHKAKLGAQLEICASQWCAFRNMQVCVRTNTFRNMHACYIRVRTNICRLACKCSCKRQRGNWSWLWNELETICWGRGKPTQSLNTVFCKYVRNCTYLRICTIATSSKFQWRAISWGRKGKATQLL